MGQMSAAVQYRCYALRCAAAAERAVEPDNKALFIELVAAWLRLADLIEKYRENDRDPLNVANRCNEVMSTTHARLRAAETSLERTMEVLVTSQWALRTSFMLLEGDNGDHSPASDH